MLVQPNNIVLNLLHLGIPLLNLLEQVYYLIHLMTPFKFDDIASVWAMSQAPH